jgi:hypothetical protein
MTAIGNFHQVHDATPGFGGCSSGLGGDTADGGAMNPKDTGDIGEYVSGYIFAPASSAGASSVTMAVTDPGLGLNGAGFHVFAATQGQYGRHNRRVRFFSTAEECCILTPPFISQTWQVSQCLVIWSRSPARNRRI